MSTSTQWQLAREAAERYERILVPAILGPFAQALVQWSDLRPGEAVLDVGCGTGVAARYAAEQVAPSGRVIGIDVNREMLEVARSVSAERGDSIEWQEGNAGQMLFDSGMFDVVLCAQTLQFIPEAQKALVEMRRVMKPDGRVAISLWCEMEQNPYFHALIEAVSKHIGADTSVGLAAIFRLSNEYQLRSLLANAGFEKVSMTVTELNLDLPGLREFVPRHISATPMAAGYIGASAEVQKAVIGEVEERVSMFKSGASWQIPFSSYLVMAEK